MAGVIGAGTVGAVGHDRVHAGGVDQANLVHLVHGKFAVVFTLGVATRNQTGGRNHRDSHPVGDEEDHIFCPSAGLRFDDRPVNSGVDASGSHRHRVNARFGNRNTTPHHRLGSGGGRFVTKGPGFCDRLNASHCGSIGAIDRHGKIFGHCFGMNFNTHIKECAGQEGGTVDGQDQDGQSIVLCKSGQRWHRRQQHGNHHEQRDNALR